MTRQFPTHLNIGISTKNLDDKIIMKDIDGNDVYDIEVNLLLFFLKVFNCTCTLLTPTLNNGAIGELVYGDADLTFELAPINERFSKYVDFSIPIFFDRLTFMTSGPEPMKKSLVILKPFSNAVWIALFIFILGFVLLFSMANARGKQFIRSSIATVGNILGQPFPIELSSRKLKMFFLVWIFGATFMIFFYRATLLSFLIYSPTKGITTIPELSAAVLDGTAKCRGNLRGDVILSLLNSTEESFRIIGKSAHENSQHWIHPKDFLGNNGKRAIIDTELNLKNFQEFFLSEDTFHTYMYSFMMRKRFKFKNTLDRIVRRMVETGVFGKILSDMDMRKEFFLGLSASSEVVNEKILTLEDLDDSFFVLIIGLSLAFFTFLAEILIYKYKK